ncbi:uncharacterized protein EDB91DRAFT_1102079 [Suillus paluster]|uniref:uncharacterized protein n=1 Tax=Suillus paluster TaxID=48578 RepID=UPI001B886274|nr:uncharacterized protein EDB91DRAFT_1102079 [Suillus paluster]KAG1752369.1 hypothetical protein EDB91DRAFT_1102079 [Suillus paluster]
MVRHHDVFNCDDGCGRQLPGRAFCQFLQVEFLEWMTGSAFGTKAVATIHGLPYAVLLWGMLYFMVAFSHQVFMSTPIITLATTGSVCGTVALFTLWLVTAARDF